MVALAYVVSVGAQGAPCDVKVYLGTLSQALVVGAVFTSLLAVSLYESRSKEEGGGEDLCSAQEQHLRGALRYSCGFRIARSLSPARFDRGARDVRSLGAQRRALR